MALLWSLSWFDACLACVCCDGVMLLVGQAVHLLGWQQGES